MATATLPPHLVGKVVEKIPKSEALFGLCEWSSTDNLCYGTLFPIAGLFLTLIVFLVYNFYITEARKKLEELQPPSHSPLIPESFKVLDATSLSSALSGVNDVPLKTFFPRIGLDFLVEPCAVLGVASIRDLLRINNLALRDVGMGPKEIRVIQRALERRIKLREKMQEAFFDAAGTQSSRRRRGQSLASKVLAARIALQQKESVAGPRDGADKTSSNNNGSFTAGGEQPSQPTALLGGGGADSGEGLAASMRGRSPPNAFGGDQPPPPGDQA